MGKLIKPMERVEDKPTRACCCHAEIAKRDAEIGRLKADLAFVSARREAASETSDRWIANYLELQAHPFRNLASWLRRKVGA